MASLESLTYPGEPRSRRTGVGLGGALAIAISWSVNKSIDWAFTLTPAGQEAPYAGHGSLFQFHESFTRHAATFLTSQSDSAPY